MHTLDLVYIYYIIYKVYILHMHKVDVLYTHTHKYI